MLTARSLAGRRFYTKLYTAEAVATGGRVGKVSVAENKAEFKLEKPTALGGIGNAPGTTNPEILFASGYSACFLGAIQAVAPKTVNKPVPADTTVTALVDFGREGAGFKLGVELKVKAPGLTADETKKLVDAAHQNATRNNIDVKLTVL